MASLFSPPTPPRLLHLPARRPSAVPPPSSPLAAQTHLSLIDLHVKQTLQSPLLIGNSVNDGGGGERNEFYLNLGMAVRTLRDDLPHIFSRDLNYDIYSLYQYGNRYRHSISSSGQSKPIIRDFLQELAPLFHGFHGIYPLRADITFSDPVNAFQGIDSYKLIFWALRFHGRMLFKEISLEVLRIWQLSDDVILIRWNLKGVPRVPWETRGEFQGTSRYKLDRKGKIYDHRVDNLAVNFPKVVAPTRSAVVMSLMAPTPCPPAAVLESGGSGGDGCCSWVRFYRAVERTLYLGELRVDGGFSLCIEDSKEFRLCSC